MVLLLGAEDTTMKIREEVWGSPESYYVDLGIKKMSPTRSLKEFYNRVTSSRGSKRAIVAVARKMLGRLRRCLKDKVSWQDRSLLKAWC